MMILSFARTTAALVAREKTVTRRLWSDAYFARMKKAFDAVTQDGRRGLLIQAWSASPHRKGRKVGVVLITSLTRESTIDIPDSDFDAEGFAYMVPIPLLPCPWCGSEEVSLVGCNYEAIACYAKGCGAMGPITYQNQALAIALWNKGPYADREEIHSAALRAHAEKLKAKAAEHIKKAEELLAKVKK